ncbi:lipid metabolic process [Rhizoctonia solani]|uniref:Lipid metabolic process n=1 Tax=Rhizoctonia solani TaxID=456999 RepID=A0A8H7M0U4_9AGAM|nr:lipid metabolic process [Rhizoctonia solani]
MHPDQPTNHQVGDLPEDDKPDPKNQSIKPIGRKRHREVPKRTAAAVAIMPQPWVPSTYKQMLDSPDAKKWRKGTVDKFQSWKSLGVYKITRVPQTQRCLGTKPVYVAKTGADGAIEQFKVRYVVLGNLQREGIDYGKTSSPTACPETLKIMVTVGTERNWEIHQMDVKTAYLHAKVDRKIYLQIPDGFPKSELPSGIPCKELALRLNKAVYGLKQAGYLWICHAMQVFVETFHSVKIQSLLILHECLPQMLRLGPNLQGYYAIVATKVRTQFAAGTGLGELQANLLANGKRASASRSQFQPNKTPLSDKDIEFMRNKPYSRVLGLLNWLANGTRLDIACLLVPWQHAKQPGPLHWMALMQVIRMDSQSAMKIALRNGFSGRTKHINIDYHYSRNLVRNKEITLTWVPGQENIADICTKPLPHPRFHGLLFVTLLRRVLRQVHLALNVLFLLFCVPLLYIFGLQVGVLDFVHFCPSVGFAIIAAAECSLAGNRVGFAIIAAAEFSVPLQRFLQFSAKSFYND